MGRRSCSESATTTNPAWFSLAPTTGGTTAPTTVTASLIQSAIDALGNGAHTGTVTVTPVFVAGNQELEVIPAPDVPQ